MRHTVQVDLVGQRDQPETHKTQIHKSVSRWKMKMGKRIHLKSGLVWFSEPTAPLFSGIH